MPNLSDIAVSGPVSGPVYNPPAQRNNIASAPQMNTAQHLQNIMHLTNLMHIVRKLPQEHIGPAAVHLSNAGFLAPHPMTVERALQPLFGAQAAASGVRPSAPIPQAPVQRGTVAAPGPAPEMSNITPSPQHFLASLNNTGSGPQNPYLNFGRMP